MMSNDGSQSSFHEEMNSLIIDDDVRPVEVSSEVTQRTHEEMLQAMRSCEQQIQFLKEERRVMSKELEQGSKILKNIQKLLLAYQGLLSQFGLYYVRRSFLRGELGIRPCSMSVLRSIDVFRRILLPAPFDEHYKDDFVDQFIQRFQSGDSVEPVDEQRQYLPHRETFGWWKGFFRHMKDEANWQVIQKFRSNPLESKESDDSYTQERVGGWKSI